MENIDMIFLFIIAAFVGYYMCKKELFEGFGLVEDIGKAISDVYSADVNAIKKLSEVTMNLPIEGIAVPGSVITRGSLGSVPGNLTVKETLTARKGISSDSKAWNNWISGIFGIGGGNDRVVLGNLDGQATVGSHNEPLTVWKPLRLQGEGINIIPDSGKGSKTTLNGNTDMKGDLTIAGGKTITGEGRLHVTGPEHLYLSSKRGVIIGKEWGGNGNLNVQGGIGVDGSITTNGRTSLGGPMIEGSTEGIVNIKNPNGTYTNFGQLNNKNIPTGDHTNKIRGVTRIDGSLTVKGRNILAELDDLLNDFVPYDTSIYIGVNGHPIAENDKIIKREDRRNSEWGKFKIHRI